MPFICWGGVADDRCAEVDRYLFAITQVVGTASETINIYLFLQAFSFYRIGHASAVVVVFFAIIVAASLIMLWLRQKTKWQ